MTMGLKNPSSSTSSFGLSKKKKASTVSPLRYSNGATIEIAKPQVKSKPSSSSTSADPIASISGLMDSQVRHKVRRFRKFKSLREIDAEKRQRKAQEAFRRGQEAALKATMEVLEEYKISDAHVVVNSASPDAANFA